MPRSPVRSIVNWPVLLALAALAIAILYYATPIMKQPRFRWVSLGAIVVWVSRRRSSGLYIANLASYDSTYGPLAGVIIFLLLLWITNLALLFGAELDAEMERGRQLKAGIAAERNIQLPLQDANSPGAGTEPN